VVSVVTNIDADHMETYGQDFEKLKATFVEFLGHLPFYGLAVLCADDPHVRAIMPSVTRPMLTYGIESDADLRAENIRWDEGRMRFTAVSRDGQYKPLDVLLNLPGVHYVLNALAVIAVAREVGAPEAAIQRGLAEFTGVGRRFQRYGEIPIASGGAFALVDDYGHHPAEMAATLAAARGAFPGRRVVLAFQPHRFTRTRDLFEDFVRVLSTADELVLADVYPRARPPIVAADGRSLARAGARGRARSSRCSSRRPPRCAMRCWAGCATATWCDDGRGLDRAPGARAGGATDLIMDMSDHAHYSPDCAEPCAATSPWRAT
jgi:UDP-N-acetylmuramate--alanine ligase